MSRWPARASLATAALALAMGVQADAASDEAVIRELLQHPAPVPNAPRPGRAPWRLDSPAPVPPDEQRPLRLLALCEREPELLPRFLSQLPHDPRTVARVEALWRANPLLAEHASIRRWLVLHDDHFLFDLVAEARSAHDFEDARVENVDSLRALARRDWASAKPILLAGFESDQPGLSTECAALLHELSGDATDEDRRRYLEHLVAVARNAQGPLDARARAAQRILAIC